ncbi:MAG: glutathionylspermidine synthase family protein [Nostocaceae cyanobacterium]|nr:glutathionylspermidine synthase family protein [Nostocaceae cyanobacterium]
MSLCHYQSAFCPIESIAMDEYGCYDHRGEPVDIIYRIYPTEWMVEDKDPQLGVSLWDYLEPLVDSRKVALINPVSAFIVQNKALMALITELGVDFFTQNNLLGFEHFLPTFMERDKINLPLVAKPTWGREGKEVEIIKTYEEIACNPDPEYAHFAKVYQKYVDLPIIKLAGEEYKLQLSCFLINGIAEGVAARIGFDVIGNNSKFMPIGFL